MFVDSHCHLDRLDLSDFSGQLDNVISSAKEAKVDKMLCVSVTLDSFESMAEKTSGYDNVHLTCGTHPLNQSDDYVDETKLYKLAKHPRVVAIGETGLDYYYAPETKAKQLDSFAKHIDVAKLLNKPLVIHTRDAQTDTMALLHKRGADAVGGVLHCFTESELMAKTAIEMGFYISFSGIITFKNAAELREVVKSVPLEHMLIETDSPYLAPVPHRGKQNQPAYVSEVAKLIASLHNVSVEQVAEQTAHNYQRLFFPNL